MNIIYKRYLPDDILNIIFVYLDNSKKVFLNKQYYIKYNHLIDKNIKNYDSYIRNIIRTDSNFIFKYQLSKHLDKWTSISKFNYSNTIFNTYLDFIINFARQNKSKKCLELINLELNISRLKKLNCKDYRTKYRKWII